MLFDSSIRKELARSFGATVVVLITVVMTMMLIRTLGQAYKGNVSPSDVLLVMGYTVLGQLPTILGLGLFVAVVGSLSRMYRDSEMVIWYSSGRGLIGFLSPVLRFAWPVQGPGAQWRGRGLARFSAGDLVGIVPSGAAAPRFYSLASASKDGVLEICVRRQDNGLCSGYLYHLTAGESVHGFIQSNARFKPAAGHSPILLIGAGTGIAPLIGFIRANTDQRPMYLYWGGRLATSDFLYQHELQACLADQRLSQLHVAFSRGAEHAYVQDKLVQDADQVRTLLKADAQILICGGRRMASDVATTLNTLLAPIALDVAALKKSGRYLEDTY